MSEPDHIARLVHDLIVTISDLSVASRQPRTAQQVFAEADDLRLAQSELRRLVERLPAGQLVAAE